MEVIFEALMHAANNMAVRPVEDIEETETTSVTDEHMKKAVKNTKIG